MITQITQKMYLLTLSCSLNLTFIWCEISSNHILILSILTDSSHIFYFRIFQLISFFNFVLGYAGSHI